LDFRFKAQNPTKPDQSGNSGKFCFEKDLLDLGKIAERNFENTDGFSFFFKAEQRLT